MSSIQSAEDSPGAVGPMLVISALFFMFGFVTWLNGSLIPFLQVACELNHKQAYLVTMAFYIAYTVMALPMSTCLRLVGYKNGLIIGLLLMMVGALCFIPAAQLRTFSLFLLALFFLGSGLTILQAAVNPYVVLIGPHETAAVRISVMGVLNKCAGVIAPIVFTAMVFSDMSRFEPPALAILSTTERALALDELSGRLVYPYVIMATLLFALALFVWFCTLPEPEGDADSMNGASSGSILQRPQLILGALALFCYVGVEVVAGDTIGMFGRDMGVKEFGQLTSYTMSFMVLGYLLGMLSIPRILDQSTALLFSCISGLLLSLLVVQSSPSSTLAWDLLLFWLPAEPLPDPVVYLALLGLANALVWPAIWPLALEDIDSSMLTTASALLIMGISGGAFLPFIYGSLADTSLGAQNGYFILIFPYAFIGWYALRGHKLRRWGRAH